MGRASQSPRVYILQSLVPFRTALFWTSSFAFILIGVAFAFYGPMLPVLARSFGITTAEAGLLMSAHSAGGLGGLLLSAAFGAVGARPALLLIAAGAAGVAWGVSWPATLAAAALLGAGYGLITSAINRRLLVEMGGQGPSMVGMVNAVYGIGAIAGPLIFLALGTRVDLAFGLIAVVSVALAPFAGDAVAPPPAGALRLGRGAWLLALGGAAVGFEVSLVGYGPSALIARGLGEEGAARYASAFFAAFLAMRVALFWLAPLVRPLLLLALAFATAGLFAGLASLVAPGLFYALAGASAGALFPAYFVAASQSLGSDGRTTALVVAAGYVGAVAVPAGGSAVIAMFGTPAILPALATLAVVAAGAAGAISREGRPATP